MDEEEARKRRKVVDNEASSSSSKAEEEYDQYEVFLSFRGSDTRTGFTSLLYEALVNARIRTFKDDNELRLGNKIGPGLLRAIQRSKISIPIFSRNYAHSKWCLRELTEMINCYKSTGQKILPIFYDVTPDVVKLKDEAGSFKKAFVQHKSDKVAQNVVQEWEKAVKDVTEFAGFEKDKIRRGDEAKLVKKVLSRVFIILKKNNVSINYSELVGMDHHIEEMTRILDVDQNDRRLIGILGMGGIGKTTIAKVIFNHFCDPFRQLCSFLPDVREKKKQDHELVDLKNKLVQDILHTGGKYGTTTLDKYTFSSMKVLIVLDDVDVDDDDEKSQLGTIFAKLNWFGLGSRIIVTTRNERVFEGQEECFVYKPEELNVDHSLQLFSKHAFKSGSPPKDYYALSKDIVSIGGGLPLFVEIVGSFLASREQNVWKDTLKKLKYIPNKQVFKKLKISYDALDNSQKQIFLDIACHFSGRDKENALYMWHDCQFYPENGIDVLLQLSLVKLDDEDDELWMHDQLRLLGQEIVHGVKHPIYPAHRSRLWAEDEVLEVLNNRNGSKRVQTLCLSWARPRYFSNKKVAPHLVQTEALRKLSNLRYLRMDRVNLVGDFKGPFHELRWLSLKCSPLSSIKFINLSLRKLVILDLWFTDITCDGWKQIEMAKRLKVLNLRRCSCSMITDFSAFPNLETLSLRECKVQLPPKLKLPTSLTKLHLPLTATSLNCVVTMVNLKRLGFNYSTSDELVETPRDLNKLTNLEKFTLFGVDNIVNLPMKIDALFRLQKLYFIGCEKLKFIPDLPPSLICLRIECDSVERLPPNLSRLKSLTILKIFNCLKLIEIPDLKGLKYLTRLNIFCCNISNIEGLERLENLEELQIVGCKSLEASPDVSNLKKLMTLCIGFCPQLASIRGLEALVFLEDLDFLFWTSLEKLPNLSNLKRLKKLQIPTCEKLEDIEGLDVENLEYFRNQDGAFHLRKPHEEESSLDEEESTWDEEDNTSDQPVPYAERVPEYFSSDEDDFSFY